MVGPWQNAGLSPAAKQACHFQMQVPVLRGAVGTFFQEKKKIYKAQLA